MKNKIILICPERRLKGNYPNGKGHAYSITPPINLLSLAYFLEEAGYCCEILDANFEDYRSLNFDDALCVGITSMSGMQLYNARSIAAFVRSKSPKTPIVWGGIHGSLVPESIAKHPLVDFVVRGEGEDTMVELVNCIRDKREPTDVKGISYKITKEKIKYNPDRPFIDMDRIGVLPYNLINITKYPLDKTGFPINTSRGCPHRCKFCYNLVYNKRIWRSQSPDNVINSVKHIVDKYGIRNFQFQVDDEFFINKKRVENICKKIIEEKLNIEWTSFNRADSIARYSGEFMNLIKQAGCKEIYIGGESGSKRMLEYISKGIDPEDIVIASRKCSEYGIVPIISFMTAFPSETEQDRRETFRIIDRIIDINPNAKINGIFSYSPYPGTPLFETAKEYGLKKFETLEDWMNFQYNDVRKIPWLTKKESSKIFVLCRLVRFPFSSKTPDLPNSLEYRGIKGMLKITIERLGYLFLWKSSQIRWKHKFFSFAPEWKLWGWYLQKNNVW